MGKGDCETPSLKKKDNYFKNSTSYNLCKYLIIKDNLIIYLLKPVIFYLSVIGIISRNIFSLLRYVLPKHFTGLLIEQANITFPKCLIVCKMCICLTKLSHYYSKLYFNSNCVLYSNSLR